SVDVASLLLAVQNSSPTTKQKFHDALNIFTSSSATNSSPNISKIIGHSYSPSASSLLLTIDQEQPALEDSSDFTWGIPPSLIDLGRANLHIPLSMQTTAATRRLIQDDASLKRVAYYTKEGQKVMIIDRSQFPDERKMTLAEWHEAYVRNLFFLSEWYDKEIVERWARHYRFCSKQDDMTDLFPAILLFDIEERMS
ncbi:hypothetical protein BJ138DRAFT_969821, partial [Hygrophoropsis aurantiaca]